MGLVIGPVNGIRKPTRTTNSHNFNIDDNIYDWFDWGHPDLPSLGDMGYGGFATTTLTKGDEILVSYTMNTVHPSYSAAGIICTEEAWNIFYEDTQQLWYDFAEASDGTLILYQGLIYDYSLLASDFLDNTTDYVNYNEYSPGEINYTATEKTELYIASIITDFDVNTNYIYGQMTVTVDGEIFRRSGYSFGWVMFGFGLIVSSISIYSLISYRSSDEIKRYEEQITLYTDESNKLEQQKETIKEE